MPVGVGSVMVQSRADVSNGQFYVAVARALAEEHQRTAGCSRTREEGLTTDTFLITLAIVEHVQFADEALSCMHL